MKGEAMILFKKQSLWFALIVVLLSIFSVSQSAQAMEPGEGQLALKYPIKPLQEQLVTPTPTPAADPTFTYPAVPSEIAQDQSASLLQGNTQGASVAQTAPAIDFGVVDIDAQKYGTEYGHWANVVRGPDGKYYFGLGNHSTAEGGQDGSLLVSYDPTTKKYEILLYAKDVFGDEGEGKWHGRPEINPETGDMYLVGFYNGHIVHYNIYTRQVEDLGAPVAGSGWPEHTWDWQREKLYGVGDEKGSLLVYDTKNRQVIHQGRPTDTTTGKAFDWDTRARLLDHETGNLYGSDASNQLVKYNAEDNTFTILKSKLSSKLRAWSEKKEADGSFWIFDDKGSVYKFYPEQDRVEYKGKNWGSDGWYVSSLERSPDGNFLYYSLASSSSAKQGLPILQYDTRTNKVKVLAFLTDYYADKHGYEVTKIYGGALSEDGKSYFVVSNGNTTDGTRLPSTFDIHIPDSEQQ